MSCPRCHAETAADASFCSRCGAPLATTVACASCGAGNTSSSRFCQGCGRPLAGAAPAPTAAAGERRHLTVMFCDVVDSTPLAQTLDAEDLHEVLRSCLDGAAGVIARHEGHVANYLGDGLLAYFGYPSAREDDAPRAVRAGLEILVELQRLNLSLASRHGVRVAVRVGIHSGEVVLAGGSGERSDRQAAGQALHLAARLQSVAAPDTVVVSEATRRLIEGIFVTEALGDKALKGVAELVAVHRALRPTGVRSRLEATAAAGLSDLVGRDRELALLLDSWKRVRERAGEAVLLSGEPGIGKSRLARALRERLADAPHQWLTCRCAAYSQQSALLPVIEMQEQTLGFGSGDSAEVKLAKLEAGLVGSGFDVAESLPLLAAFHTLPVPAPYEAPNLSPDGQRRRTLELLVEWLIRLGRRQPTVLLMEDLHWVDPSTLELLGRVIARLGETQVLTLCTFRSDFTPALEASAQITTMPLRRLTSLEAEQMIEGTASGRAIPADVVRQIVSKTDGVPLFVEELTKTVLTGESGGRPGEGFSVPGTLQDLLTARLDRLGPAKEVAQLCAVVGREFSYEVARSVAELDDTALNDAFERLVAADLLVETAEPPGRSYQFKHALIQEAAYRSLLKVQRQRHHQRVGAVLEKKSGLSEAQPELIAYHYTEAGQIEPAIGYWRQAGQRAILRSENVEAISHLDQALALIARLPDGGERLELELGARMQQALGLIATRGYGSNEAKETFARARELCRQFGETPQLFPVLFGLWLFYLVRADAKVAPELAEQLLRFAESVGDPALLLEAHGAMTATAYWRGDHTRAREHSEKSFALYDREQCAYHAFLYGQDPGAFDLLYAGLSSWFLGYPDRALGEVRRAMELAEQLKHPFTLAGVLHLGGDLYYRRRESKLDLEYAERTIALSEEHGFPLWLGGAMSSRAWALVEDGRLAEGLSQLREALTRVVDTGANINGPYVRSKLVEACRRAGLKEEGLRVVDEALNVSQAGLDRYWEAELHRQKGDLLLLPAPDAAAAERCFEQALAVARAQEARSLELRAATSLARLRRTDGRTGDARRLLAEVYDWFTEGFDTPDLQDAKALLDGLQGELRPAT